MENAHYFLHVTDTHLCFDAEAPDICCTEQALRSLYQTAFAWDHRPAFVLITGDLVHEGTSADYARAKTLLQELDEQYHTKTYPALGNHDNRENFNSAFREQACGLLCTERMAQMDRTGFLLRAGHWPIVRQPTCVAGTGAVRPHRLPNDPRAAPPGIRNDYSGN